MDGWTDNTTTTNTIAINTTTTNNNDMYTYIHTYIHTYNNNKNKIIQKNIKQIKLISNVYFQLVIIIFFRVCLLQAYVVINLIDIGKIMKEEIFKSENCYEKPIMARPVIAYRKKIQASRIF